MILDRMRTKENKDVLKAEDSLKYFSGIVIDRHDNDFYYVTRIVLVRRPEGVPLDQSGFIDIAELKNKPELLFVFDILNKNIQVGNHAYRF
jgi:hypothetical protein